MATGLPSVRYHEKEAEEQVVAFGGLNMTQTRKDGTLESCMNLTAENYPCLSARKGRTALAEQERVTAMYAVGDELITVKSGVLYLGSDRLCAVEDGEKQFATVNTKVMVWPDMVMVDLVTRSAREIGKKHAIHGLDCSFARNSLTVPVHPVVEGKVTPTIWGWDGNWRGVGIWVYKNPEWNAENGWSWTYRQVKPVWELSVGDVLMLNGNIPEENGELTTVEVADYRLELPTDWEDVKNERGYYCVVTKVGKTDWVKDGTGMTGQIGVECSVKNASMKNFALNGVFQAGDYVTISNCPVACFEGVGVKVEDVTEDVLTFAQDTFPFVPRVIASTEDLFAVDEEESISDAYVRLIGDGFYNTGVGILSQAEAAQQGVERKVWWEDNVTEVTVHDKIVLDVDGKIHLVKPDGTIFSRTAHKNLSPGNSGVVVLDSYVPDYTGTVIGRSMPKLDYICAAQNRLWGVANAEKNQVWDGDAGRWHEYESRVIYASALGTPDRFYDYQGLSTDSYAVAVGTEGNFTGICPMGTGVAFFTAGSVHVLSGTTPSGYHLYDYKYKGVGAGSGKSLVNINERIYYLGADGVYVITESSSPQKISDWLGNCVFSCGVGGTDGSRYWLSMRDASGNYGLYVYDPEKGIWLREDSVRVMDFTRVGNKFLMATDDGSVVRVDDENSTEKVEWSAVFCPMEEYYHNRKCLSRLLLRYELGQGASLSVAVSLDGGPWETLQEVRAEEQKTSILPVRINRCDSWRLKLSGTGQFTLRSMVRRVLYGGLR